MHQPFSPACYAILVPKLVYTSWSVEHFVWYVVLQIANCQISKRKQ